MKGDMQVMKATHAGEVKRFQGDVEALRGELGVTRTNLEDSQQQGMDLAANVKAQNDELDRIRNMQEETTIEVLDGC